MSASGCVNCGGWHPGAVHDYSEGSVASRAARDHAVIARLTALVNRQGETRGTPVFRPPHRAAATAYRQVTTASSTRVARNDAPPPPDFHAVMRAASGREETTPTVTPRLAARNAREAVGPPDLYAAVRAAAKRRKR